MSLKSIDTSIARFLSEPGGGVLCLRGVWGVGKTYVWNDCLQRTSQSDAVYKSYSYCSLFGLNSLEDLKASIFEQLVSLDKKAANSSKQSGQIDAMLMRLQDKWQRGKEFGRKGSAIAKDIIGYGNATSRLLFMSISDQIVCFDDLERRGKSLNIGDVLGLASYLKEQRNCKVVLILNEEKLDKDALREFNAYLEKVVDVSLRYLPSPQECAAIGIPGRSELATMLRRYTATLAITNIRVIKRVEKLARGLEEPLKSAQHAVRDAAMRSLAIMAWVHFMPEAAPGIDFLRDHFGTSITGARYNDKEERWNQLLIGVGFVSVSNFDEVVLSAVDNGYLLENELAEHLRALEEMLDMQAIEKRFARAWEQVSESLGSVDDDALLQELIAVAPKIVCELRPAAVDILVRTIRDLGRPSEATALIDAYMAGTLFVEQIEGVEDLELRHAIEQSVLNKATPSSTTALLEHLALSGPSPALSIRLRSLTPEDIAAGLNGLRRNLSRSMEALLKCSEVADNGMTVAANARQAFAILASQSPLKKSLIDKALERISHPR